MVSYMTLLFDGYLNRSYAVQIWDFHLGQTRHQEESGRFEVGFGGNNKGFMIDTYSATLKPSDLTSSRALDDLHDTSCSRAHDDFISSKVGYPPSDLAMWSWKSIAVTYILILDFMLVL